jgi:hypothetical protein
MNNLGDYLPDNCKNNCHTGHYRTLKLENQPGALTRYAKVKRVGVLCRSGCVDAEAAAAETAAAGAAAAAEGEDAAADAVAAAGHIFKLCSS